MKLARHSVLGCSYDPKTSAERQAVKRRRERRAWLHNGLIIAMQVRVTVPGQCHSVCHSVPLSEPISCLHGAWCLHSQQLCPEGPHELSRNGPAPSARCPLRRPCYSCRPCCACCGTAQWRWPATFGLSPTPAQPPSPPRPQASTFTVGEGCCEAPAVEDPACGTAGVHAAPTDQPACLSSPSSSPASTRVTLLMSASASLPVPATAAYSLSAVACQTVGFLVSS